MDQLQHQGRAAVTRRALRLAGVAVFVTTLCWPQPAAAAPTRVLIPDFPAVRQWYSLDCEYTAAAAVTLYWGNLVSQRDFLREVHSSPNPHLGFRGNVDGPLDGIVDYGVYAEPLVPVLEARGYEATVFYGGQARLEASLRDGNPVVVWLTTGRQARPSYTATYQGQSFRLVPAEHAVVAYGYDSYGIYVMDVGNGQFYHTDWPSFLRRWGYFDDMALLITPQLPTPAPQLGGP